MPPRGVRPQGDGPRRVRHWRAAAGSLILESDMSAQDHTHVRPWRAIERRKSRQIHVGPVAVGGDAPISVQSMTNTVTADAQATIEQVRQLAEAGADIVRVSCPDEASTAAMPAIV